MTKGLSAAQLALVQSTGMPYEKWAVAIDLATPLRFCSGADAVSVGGNVHTPRAMSISDFALTSPDDTDATLTLDNGDDTLSEAFYGEGFAGALVTLYWLLSAGATTWTTVETISMRVAEAQSSGPLLSLELKGAASLQPGAILTVGSATCPLKFKGSLCQYAGTDTTCDKSYTACGDKGNTAHFRGFRAAPAPGTTVKFGTGQAFYVGMPRGSERLRLVRNSGVMLPDPWSPEPITITVTTGSGGASEF